MQSAYDLHRVGGVVEGEENMKEEKSWSEMMEEEWKKEKERIKKIQDRHFGGEKE